MPLTKLVTEKPVDTGEAPKEKFVGMRLGWDDYVEYCTLVGVSPAAGGTAAFKAGLMKLLKAEGKI